MQTEMLDDIKHTSKYKIMKDNVDIYNAEKHRLPCWNCMVRSLPLFWVEASKKNMVLITDAT